RLAFTAVRRGTNAHPRVAADVAAACLKNRASASGLAGVVSGVTPTISTRPTSSPGTTGWIDDAQPTPASVKAVQTTVVTKPPIAEAVAAAGVVRVDERPKINGKKNVAATMATAYDTMARISSGVRRARSSETSPTATIATREAIR